MEAVKEYGPYKATKLWNEMVETFRNGIPLKRHRRHIKVYDNCFTGQEAVTWFQSILQNNLHLGNNVTKEQTIQLLNKFLKAGIFQNVSSSSSDIHHQYIKEGDIYQIINTSSPRIPLPIRLPNTQLKPKSQQWNGQSACPASYNTVGLPVLHQTQSWTQQSSPPLHFSSSSKELTLKENRRPAPSLDTKYMDQLQKHETFVARPLLTLNRNTVYKAPSKHTEEQRSSYNRGLTSSAEQHNLGFTASPTDTNQEYVKREKRLYKDPCTWLDPLTLDSADHFEVQRASIPVQDGFSTMKAKINHGYSNLPKFQTIQRSASVLQPRSKIEVASTDVENYPHAGFNKFGKVNQNVHKEVHQPSHYRTTSVSQLRNNEYVEKDTNTKDVMGTLTRTDNAGSTKRDVVKDNQHFNVGAAWKQIIVTRLEKLMPGLDIPFKLELENVPGEWICANGATKIYKDHDSQFPQSLVAAMNCLVHWPQTVPNEILTAFKEHYFKLKEPLTTFKMYSLLIKVYFYITSSGVIPNSSGILTMKLPPNSCFETAFTSDSPVTRIVPQRSVDTLHFSRHGKCMKSAVPKRIASAPNLSEQMMCIQGNRKENVRPSTKNQKSGKFSVKLSRKMNRRARIGTEEDKMYHVRNKSGGYVNPALSQSIDDDLLDPTAVPEQELDYVAALASLNTLMKHSVRDTSFSVAGCRESDGPSSESSSYYTAASSSSSSSAASSRRSSLELVDSVDVAMEESKEKLLVSAMQLLLLCIPAYCRTQLRYLLHFMNQWNSHNSLCSQADIINIFMPTILRSNFEEDMNLRLAYDIVYFLVTHHESVLSVPLDIENEVSQHLRILQSQNVKLENRVTYCEQVSKQQFEEQKLTSSQLALTELLEQILQDCKMGPKEKRKRLKMFKESYPHIYHRRFPDSATMDKVLKKPSGGLLNLATLSRFKSLRV